MGDIIDAASRFNAARYVQWWDAFCSGQMNTTQLNALVHEDAGFRAYAVARCQEIRDRQHEDKHADDMA